MYRETPPEDFDLDLDRYSATSYSVSRPPPDIQLGCNIIIRNGPYDEVFLVQSSISFAQAYEGLCEAMERLSLEGEGDEEQQEDEVDEIRAALDRLSFVESCPHDEVGETTLVEWEDSDSEATVADDESWLAVCTEEATKRARTGKELPEEVGRAVWNSVSTKGIHADALHPIRSTPISTGPWILAAMCRVGLECKACTTPPSYRTLVAPVFQNLIKRA